MRKIVVTLIVASFLFSTSVTPVFAGGWGGGHHHGREGGFNPLWPIAVALTIPAAIIGTVVNLAATVPAPYGYAGPQAPEPYYAPGEYYAPYAAPTGYYEPGAYAAPTRYYAPRAYAAPTRYYAPRAYAEPTRNFVRRGYYPVSGYREYRNRW